LSKRPYATLRLGEPPNGPIYPVVLGRGDVALAGDEQGKPYLFFEWEGPGEKNITVAFLAPKEGEEQLLARVLLGYVNTLRWSVGLPKIEEPFEEYQQ
jgi:hypothetical protein